MSKTTESKRGGGFGAGAAHGIVPLLCVGLSAADQRHVGDDVCEGQPKLLLCMLLASAEAVNACTPSYISSAGECT